MTAPDEDSPAGPARCDERNGYAAAEQLQAQRPHWMILYGCYTRQFVAWPKFPVTRSGIIIRAYYPSALIDRLDRAERAYRLHPPQDEPGPQPLP